MMMSTMECALESGAEVPNAPNLSEKSTLMRLGKQQCGSKRAKVLIRAEIGRCLRTEARMAPGRCALGWKLDSLWTPEVWYLP